MVTSFRVNSTYLRLARRRDFHGITKVERDAVQPRTVTDVLIVLGTPRCGSNFFCALLGNQDLVHPFEYFNPANLMPVLAHRWGCVRHGALDFICYGHKLAEKRVHSSGWLGLKVHASHIGYLARALPALAGSNVQWIHLRRRDHIGQAISYFIAQGTGGWSSPRPATTRDLDYSFEKIRLCLRKIDHWKHITESFITNNEISALEIYYEDIVDDREAQLRRLPVLASRELRTMDTEFRRQATGRNAEWAKRFMADLLEAEFRQNRTPGRRLFTNLRRRAGSFVWG